MAAIKLHPLVVGAGENFSTFQTSAPLQCMQPNAHILHILCVMRIVLQHYARAPNFSYSFAKVGVLECDLRRFYGSHLIMQPIFSSAGNKTESVVKRNRERIFIN